MKPNFALDLSHDGISLLHRGISGWTLVGEVALDDPMMGTHLAELRRTAAELESGGVTCKLVIPNSQLLYATVEAPGPDDISREVQIRAALEGMTPYEVGDLVFDWRAEGEQARVAVLARETMDEAENFAVEHRFNPVSFVARPDSGDFSGEPFFGKTRAATRILPPGERLVPDTSPVPRRPRALELPAEARVTDALMWEATPEPVESPAPEVVRDRGRVTAASTAQSWKRELPDPFAGFDDAPDLSEPEPAPDPLPEPEAAPDPVAPVDEPAPKAQPTRRRSTRSADAKGASPVLAPFPPTPDEIDAAAAAQAAAPRTPRPERSGTASPGETAPAAPKGDEDSGQTPWEGRATPAPKIPSAPPPLPMRGSEPALKQDDAGAPPPLPFQTRRDPGLAGSDAPARPVDPGTRSGGEAPERAAPATTPNGQTPAKPATEAPRRVEYQPDPPPRLDALRADMAEALKKPLPTPDKPFDKPRGGLLGGVFGKFTGRGAKRREDVATGAEKPGDSGIKTPVKADRPVPAIPPAPRPAAAIPPAPAPVQAPAPGATPAPADKTREPERRRKEAEAMTVFGARRDKDLDRRPRYLGVILTLALILVMAIVALWATFFDGDETVSLFNPGPGVEVVPGDEPPPATADTPPGGTAPESELSPTNPPTPETLPETSAPPVVDPAAIEEAVTEALPPATPPAAPPATPTGEMLTPEAAEASYAATGIWQRAPDPMGDPATTRADVPTPAALAPIAEMRDVPALPDAVNGLTESPPPNTMAPPPPGTSFAIGEGGLVVATPEGTVAPSGILVYSGRPAKTPPPRPLEAGLPRAEGVPRVKPLPRPADLVIPAEPILPDPPVPAAPAEVPAETPADAPAETPAAGAGVGAADDGAALDLPPQTPAPETPLPQSELAAVTPRARPADLVVAASNAPDGEIIDAAVETVIDAAFADATELAVARSLAPQHRPDNFAAIVDSVREAMSDGSRVAAAPAAAVAAAAPAAAVSAAPVIPASADVATRATVENAINLREVNLIGIYGGTNSRRALVRLENGRYVKVKVGDRLDGGQVTSITASQLIYQKGRKVHALNVLPLG